MEHKTCISCEYLDFHVERFYSDTTPGSGFRSVRFLFLGLTCGPVRSSSRLLREIVGGMISAEERKQIWDAAQKMADLTGRTQVIYKITASGYEIRPESEEPPAEGSLISRISPMPAILRGIFGQQP